MKNDFRYWFNYFIRGYDAPTARYFAYRKLYSKMCTSSSGLDAKHRTSSSGLDAKHRKKVVPSG